MDHPRRNIEKKTVSFARLAFKLECTGYGEYNRITKTLDADHRRMKESCIRRLDNKTVGEWDDRNAGEPERINPDELIGTAFDFFFLLDPVIACQIVAFAPSTCSCLGRYVGLAIPVDFSRVFPLSNPGRPPFDRMWKFCPNVDPNNDQIVEA